MEFLLLSPSETRVDLFNIQERGFSPQILQNFNKSGLKRL